jgi:pilus assembly protein Flp/PilA
LYCLNLLIKEDIIMEESFMHEEGQGLVEYALILVLVAVVVIAILLQLGPAVGNVFSSVIAGLTTAGSGGSQQITFVGTPSVTKTGAAMSGCQYTVSAVVNVTQEGNPVSGASVSGTVTVRDNNYHFIGTVHIDGTSGATGQATLTGSQGASCGGQQAVVSIHGGPSQTIPVP